MIYTQDFCIRFQIFTKKYVKEICQKNSFYFAHWVTVNCI